MPLYYRKNSVMIEAIHFTGDNLDEIVEFTNGGARKREFDGRVIYFIDTLEESVILSIGDYVIKGVDGEFYTCRADVFEETYEKV